MIKKYTIYCDLDGVLTNFRKGYYELTGIDIDRNFANTPEFWAPINKAGYSFWINLEWMPDGKILWRYISQYNPYILSAPSNKKSSRKGKTDWVKRELPETKLILKKAEEKKDFAAPNSILIDDLIENINDWNNAGGIGILHINTKTTIQKLQKMNYPAASSGVSF
jgi:5'(3')-deoxyribonucleotidase